jgi:transcriptional regulator with XRE-family HTH domain
MQARGYDEARVARELTQQFGEAVTARAVYSWLAGERNPSMERLKQLAKLLDCEFAHLADDPGKEPK